MICQGTTRRLACRIGPLVLAAESDAANLMLSPPDAVGADAVLKDFTAEENAAPDLTLHVEPGRPEMPPPKTEPVYRHRTGWDLYDRGDAWLAVKAIPYKSPQVKRSLAMKKDAEQADLGIAVDEQSPFGPFAYTLSELLALMLSCRRPLLLLHGAACLDRSGAAHLFIGPSGVGKSTLATIWRERLPGHVLGDESHIVCPDESGAPRVYGTPWPGSSGCYANQSAPLAGAWFLRHGPRHATAPVAPAERFTRLLANAWLPVFSRQAMQEATRIAALAAERVPCAELAFTPRDDVVDFVMACSDREKTL